MSNELTADRLAELRAAIEKAHNHVAALCEGKTKWTMRIPADEDRDSDLVISAGLSAGEKLLAEIERLTDEVARVTDMARANEEAHRAEIRQILAFYDGSGGIPFVGEVAMCADHGCPQALCECFPAASIEEGPR
jgi:hypothetical protein